MAPVFELRKPGLRTRALKHCNFICCSTVESLHKNLICFFYNALYFLECSLNSKGFPGGSDRKESACNAGDGGSIPGAGRSPGEGSGNPLPVFLPGKPHGQRSLKGFSP